MAGQNGITPLDEDNLQHKLSHDTRSGDLIFIGPGQGASNTAPVIVGGVMNLPFAFEFYRDYSFDPPFSQQSFMLIHPMRALWGVVSRTPAMTQQSANGAWFDPFSIAVSGVGGGALEPARWGSHVLLTKAGPMAAFTTGQALGQGVTGALLVSSETPFGGVGGSGGATSGYLQIGQEIVQFNSRTGTTVNVNARARFGTEDVAHKSGAECRIFVTFAAVDGYIAVVC